jgi:hypothetical protein
MSNAPKLPSKKRVVHKEMSMCRGTFILDNQFAILNRCGPKMLKDHTQYCWMMSNLFTTDFSGQLLFLLSVLTGGVACMMSCC